MPGLRPRSDYERMIGGESVTTAQNTGPNDATMASKRNDGWLSEGFNSIVEGAAQLFGGYETTRRTGSDDNDFYRDNAQYMPGYSIDGMPSAAWAQDRATNHVAHGTTAGNPWDNIRRGLVEKESGMIDADLAAGGDGRIGFGDVYDAHVEAFSESGGGGNPFIDPGTFALACYATPALEALGVDAGAFPGAALDWFNHAEDSALEGWVKRMGLGMAEVGAGVLTGNPLLTGLGLGGMLWNTATALGGEGLANQMSDMGQGALNLVGDGLDFAGNAIGAVGGAVSGAAGAVGGALGSAAGWVGERAGDLFSGW